MAIRPRHRPGESASARAPALAGLLTTDIKERIADILSRPYRAFWAAGTSAVIDEVPVEALRGEIDALPSNQHVFDSCGFEVYWARARQIPWVLQELGRLRELTFRAVGEGSGKEADIDPFDAHYLHMFVWDTHASAIVGGYRLGLVDEILATHGKRGLYTHSLFKYRTRLLDTLNPAIELGRSFVRVEYQRSFAPMMLLWSGIGRFIAKAPQYAILFGPVSISNSYSSISRQLIVDYLLAQSAENQLASQVRPRRPFREHGPRFTGAEELSLPRTVDELSRMIEEIEPDQKAIPVLLRQYLRLGGRILAFNVDRQFGHALDGLVVVDLRQTEPALVARYMGKPGMITFRAHHGLDSDRGAASPRS